MQSEIDLFDISMMLKLEIGEWKKGADEGGKLMSAMMSRACPTHVQVRPRSGTAGKTSLAGPPK